MLIIHTPLSRVSRVSRNILPGGGPVVTGRWAALVSDGQIKSPEDEIGIHKLVIGNSSSSQYEAQDVKSGRITTVESIGDRFSTVLGEGVNGPWNMGDRFWVHNKISEPSFLGTLRRYQLEDRVPGVLEIVAMALNDMAPEPGAILEFQTISPYTLIQNTVQYFGNDHGAGEPPSDTTIYAKGATVTVLGNTGGLAKAGYTFGGWNTESDGSGTHYDGGDTFVVGDLHDIRLYAVWVP